MLKAQKQPLKARQVASIIRGKTGSQTTRQEVNRILYGLRASGVATVDSNYLWTIAAAPGPRAKDGDRSQEREPKTRRAPTHYDTLQVAPNAHPEVIRKAYKALINIYHPDRATPENRQEFEEKARLINFAYEVLSDGRKRKEYDRTITLQ